jgi:hypothetical protein
MRDHGALDGAAQQAVDGPDRIHGPGIPARPALTTFPGTKAGKGPPERALPGRRDLPEHPRWAPLEATMHALKHPAYAHR